MPVYTYRRENCGIQFDRQQSFHDAPLTTCPECRQKAVRRVYKPVGIIFKGSGFYATDHRSPSGVSSGTKDKPAGKQSSNGERKSTPSTSSSE